MVLHATLGHSATTVQSKTQSVTRTIKLTKYS
uniref:Uncharacterized protein n=1 Tax=Arundo donax TaxID=35708 RepID=A0A0A9EV53_ARUDO